MAFACAQSVYAGRWEVSCSCSAVSCNYEDCDGYGVSITPHDKIIETKNINYDPSSSGNEQSHVYDKSEVKTGTQNNSDSPMTVTDHVTVSINENITISVGGTASVEYSASAELSYGVVSGSVGYSLGFQVSGSYAVEQGSVVTHTCDHGPFTLPAHKQSNYTAKFYKDKCDVAVTQEKRVAHLGNCATCTVRTGPVGSWGDESGNSSGFKWEAIYVSYEGITDVTS